MRIHLLFLKSVLIIAFMMFTVKLSANPIDDVWDAFKKNNRKQARELLNTAIANPQYKVEASMIMMLLNILEEKDQNLSLMQSVFTLLDDPSPYLYSLWLSDAVTDGYNKKDKARLGFIKEIFSSTKPNGSIKAALHYMNYMHFIFSNDTKNALKENLSVGSVANWQFVGPFDNTSGSGFDKVYGPLTHPEQDYKFKSMTNANITWFSPKYLEPNPWLMMDYYIPCQQAIIYAQSFVTSPADQDIYIALGGYGSLKLWVNDQQVISQMEERQTEMDVYVQKIKLVKGVNRILVQLGFTDKVKNANFIVRLVNSEGVPVPGIISSQKNGQYPDRSSNAMPTPIKHFAEVYFEKKIKSDPNNILNYLLLSKCYYRRQDYNSSIEVLKKAQKLQEKNILINFELLLNYSKIQNRTEILKQIEFVRSLDPDITFLAEYDFENDAKNDNLNDMEKDLKKIKKTRGGESETYYNYLIRYQIAKQDYDGAIETIDAAHLKYPENYYFLNLYVKIIKKTGVSSGQITKMFEKFLATNYSATIIDALVDEYAGANNNSKVESVLLKYYPIFPQENTCLNKLMNFYYGAKDYKKALEVVKVGLDNAPYYYMFWSNKGYIDAALKNVSDAIKDFKIAIMFNPNLFEARERLRELEGKTPLLNYFRDTAIYETIDYALTGLKKTDDNYQYLLYEKNYAVFPEGASIEYSSFAVKVQNEAGVKHWKNVYIPFNSYQQNLTIEKAEVLKKNGQKVKAEEDDNELVFPSLEENDVIYLSYRIENYTGGKLCKEFWEDYVFNAFYPMQSSTFRLLTPKGFVFNVDTFNLGRKPQLTSIDDFDLYEWSYKDLPKSKDEDYMPQLGEVGMVLNISTVNNWRTIADWYSDIAMPQTKEDYNVLQAYDEIFGDKAYKTDYLKAKAIYDYICNNINYSSVSFLQSSYTPQKPMVTLSTQLGDCKDLATLYYTLANKAGLKTHIVLVNTADNGENLIKMPSINFNHAIIKIDLGDTALFQELTVKRLAFGAIPGKLKNAQALIIPNNAADTNGNKLIHIPEKGLINTGLKRVTYVKVEDNNLNITTSLTGEGSASSWLKEDFNGLTKEETEEQIKSDMDKVFETNVKLDTFYVHNIDNRDSLYFESDKFKVNGAVKTIGGLSAIKPPFFEKIFTTDAFSKDERTYPVIYWRYEANTYYETKIVIELPKGSKLEELPKNLTVKNRFVDYKLTIVKTPGNKVEINRSVKINNRTFPAEYYAEFKKTMAQIIKAEDIYIGYK